MNHDMTTGPVWKKLLLFMLPVFGANLLQALYGTVDLMVVGINFSMMGYLNGNGKTFFVALQGILSTFLVRIPVSYFMSKIAGVTLFQIGFATPLATVFGIILNIIYLIHFEHTRRAKQAA